MPSPVRLLIAEEDPDVRAALRAAAGGVPVAAVYAAGSPDAFRRAVIQDRPDVVYVGLTQPDGAWTDVLTELQGAGRFVGAVVVVDAERTPQRLVGVLQALTGSGAAEGDAPLRTDDRLPIPVAGRIVLVRVSDLCWVEGAGTYVRLHARRQTYLYRESIQRLEARLDPRRFVRIHRSTIVNVECVEALEHLSKGRYAVYLADGTELKLSRSYRDRLATLLGSDAS